MADQEMATKMITKKNENREERKTQKRVNCSRERELLQRPYVFYVLCCEHHITVLGSCSAIP